MKFEYCAEVKNGYKPTMETNMIDCIYFTVEAKNRVTADRMVSALLQEHNILNVIGVAID